MVVQEGFTGERCLSLIAEHRVTRTQMVPAHFVRLLEADWRSHDRSSIRLVIHAAAACPVPLKWRILEVFPRGTVWELYGATEAMGTVISPGEWLLKPGSVGRPFPGLEVRILDEEGRQLPPGEIGTIYVSTFPGASFAYRGDEEKTAAARRDGFVTVGDLGHLDAHGYLFIADRRTDLIITGGVNVYPAEVENALAADPDVADSAVIGLPDERMGQRVHAIVELRRGAAADAEAISARLADRLADFKRPRTYEFVDTLPRQPNGKVLKWQLRRERTAAADPAPGDGTRIVGERRDARRCHPPAGTTLTGHAGRGRPGGAPARSPHEQRTRCGANRARDDHLREGRADRPDRPQHAREGQHPDGPAGLGLRGRPQVGRPGHRGEGPHRQGQRQGVLRRPRHRRPRGDGRRLPDPGAHPRAHLEEAQLRPLPLAAPQPLGVSQGHHLPDPRLLRGRRHRLRLPDRPHHRLRRRLLPDAAPPGVRPARRPDPHRAVGHHELEARPTSTSTWPPPSRPSRPANGGW